jgi:hypothetical protein
MQGNREWGLTEDGESWRLYPASVPRVIEPIHPRPAYIVEQGMAGGLVLPSQRRRPAASVHGPRHDGEADQVEMGSPRR